MSTRMWRSRVSKSDIGLYLFGAVALGAIAIVSLALGDGEARGVTAPERSALRAIDEALTRGDVTTAERTWPEAYSAALRSQRWEGLVAVGDARLRIDQAVGAGSKTKARETYLAALFRARQEGSLDGVLRAAEVFEALGDTEAARQALRIAEAVAGPDPGSAVQARLAVLREGLAAHLALTPRGREGLLVEP